MINEVLLSFGSHKSAYYGRDGNLRVHIIVTCIST